MYTHIQVYLNVNSMKKKVMISRFEMFWRKTSLSALSLAEIEVSVQFQAFFEAKLMLIFVLIRQF